MAQEIKNKELRKGMERLGLGGYHLWKYNGYFVLNDENDDYVNSIYVYSFRQMTIEHWLEVIEDLCTFS